MFSFRRFCTLLAVPFVNGIYDSRFNGHRKLLTKSICSGRETGLSRPSHLLDSSCNGRCNCVLIGSRGAMETRDCSKKQDNLFKIGRPVERKWRFFSNGDSETKIRRIRFCYLEAEVRAVLSQTEYIGRSRSPSLHCELFRTLCKPGTVRVIVFSLGDEKRQKCPILLKTGQSFEDRARKTLCATIFWNTFWSILFAYHFLL